MKINPKSEKGAITLVVLVAMLFLIAFLMSLYIGIANKARTSAETTKQIAEKYNNIDEANTIYDSYFADTDVIPIYTKEQLAKVGSGEKVLINGKIYTFSKDGYYTIQNDLDLGGVYNESTGTWSGTQWTPITSSFTGIIDGLGNTIKGIYLGENEGSQGIFQELNGTVKNVYVKDSYKVTNLNGLLAGTNNGEILNCYYEKALIGLKVGDYVNYTPTTGTYTVAKGTNGSGYTSDQSFTTEDLDWRILSINEQTGEIELISATAAQINTPVYIQGVDGYNHGVDILNDLCEKLYSNENGAKARSINVEDINAKTTYDFTTYKEYNNTKQLSTYGTNSMKYPNLYSEEKGYGSAGTINVTGLNGSEGKKDGVTDVNGVTTYSTVTGSADGNVNGTDSYVTCTYYHYVIENYLADLGINKVPKGLLNIKTKYWLASRCIQYDSSSLLGYSIRSMNDDGTLADFRLFFNSGWGDVKQRAVRPVVSLEDNVSFTIDTTNSTETTTYWNIQYLN